MDAEPRLAVDELGIGERHAPRPVNVSQAHGLERLRDPLQVAIQTHAGLARGLPHHGEARVLVRKGGPVLVERTSGFAARGEELLDRVVHADPRRADRGEPQDRAAREQHQRPVREQRPEERLAAWRSHDALRTDSRPLASSRSIASRPAR